MRNKKEIENSIFALEQYIAKDVRRADIHKAWVLVHVNGKDYPPGMRTVCVSVNGNVGQVIIEDLHTIYGDCLNAFTAQDSIFTIFSNTLCIKATDRFGKEISINIT